MTDLMPERIIKLIASIPDHIHALLIILMGSILSIRHPHDTAPAAILAAGLSLWRGAPACKPE
jgi:hypothetical protein